MLFNVHWINNIFPNTDQVVPNGLEIHNVTIDSRELVENGLFIPLVGDRFDGHNYIKQAVENGAVAMLWEQARPLPQGLTDQVIVFFVKDTLIALQALAHAYRQEISPIVIGITGSNGKTSTKDLTASVLQTTYETHFTAGNFNNHIGLPLTILAMPRTTEILIVEMGMNHFGEIELLSRLACPSHVVITNIGESHIENLGSKRGIAQEKLDICKGLQAGGYIVFDGDEPLLDHLHNNKQALPCSLHEHFDHGYLVEDVVVNRKGTTFSLNNTIYEVPLYGVHHARNATYAIVIAEVLGVTIESQQRGLKAVSATGMRFEWLEGKAGSVIINDAYNASPTSMLGAIDVVRKLDDYTKKILVLGDIFELGVYSEQMHTEIGEQITDDFEYIFTYGKAAKFINLAINERNLTSIAIHSETKEELIDSLTGVLDAQTLVLFKASRGVAFEDLIERLKG